MAIDATWYKKPKHKIYERLSAGGVVVREEKGLIYVSLILEGRFKDFSLPKGGVKSGEDLETAARREIHEETGISDLKMIEYLGKRERLNISKKKWNSVHYFLFTTRQKFGTPTDQEQKHIAKWFLVDELPSMLWPEQKRLIERSRKKIKELFE
jgi:ADP-ribose pyrophosphatase YjhB (NUDIX family)